MSGQPENPLLQPEIIEELHDTYDGIKRHLNSAQKKAAETGQPLLVMLGEDHETKAYITFALTRRALGNMGGFVSHAVVEADEFCAGSCGDDNTPQITPHLLNSIFLYASHAPQQKLSKAFIMADLNQEQAAGNIKLRFGDENFIESPYVRDNEVAGPNDYKAPTSLEIRNASMASSLQDIEQELLQRDSLPQKTAVIVVGGDEHFYGLLSNYGLMEKYTPVSIYTSDAPYHEKVQERERQIQEGALDIYPDDPLARPQGNEESLSYDARATMYTLDSENTLFVHYSFDQEMTVTIPQVHEAIGGALISMDVVPKAEITNSLEARRSP